MLKKTKRIIPVAFQLASLAVPGAVLAQEDIVPNQLTTTSTNNIITIVRAVIQFILIAAFVIAFIMLLVGGIRWILAGGDEKAVAGARGTITAALIGLVIVLVAFALIRIVETFFNVSILTGGVSIPTVAP